MMAVSLVVMAAIQVGVIIAVLRVAKQSMSAIEDLKREIRPLAAKVNQIADDARRATTLAAAQVERVDRFMATATSRVDDTLNIVQGFVGGPVRHAAGIIAAIKAAVQGVEYLRNRRRSASTIREEDDALFVG
jgi:hypothetical protein